MSLIGIIWLLILVLAHFGLYKLYIKTSNSTCTGDIGNALATIILAIILVIADISTIVSYIF